MSERTWCGPGSEGMLVEIVQEGLQRKKFGVKTTGVYDEITANGVRWVQRQSGLPDSGAVDTETWTALIGGDGPPSLMLRCVSALSWQLRSTSTSAILNDEGLCCGVVGLSLRNRLLPELIKGVRGDTLGEEDRESLQILQGKSVAELLAVFHILRRYSPTRDRYCGVISRLMSDPDMQQRERRLVKERLWEPVERRCRLRGVDSEAAHLALFQSVALLGGVTRRADDALSGSSPSEIITGIAEATERSVFRRRPRAVRDAASVYRDHIASLAEGTVRRPRGSSQPLERFGIIL